ncbi:MAG: ribonuclease E/G, partial [Candidatus Aenigmatarchaeota archaeon]
IPDAKEGIFQVTHEDSGKTVAHLGSYYTIPGDLIVIVPYNNKVIISKKITDGRQKKRLFDLGKEIQLQKRYGYIFRTAAKLASREEILAEVEELEKELIETQQTITEFPDKIGEIYSNFRSVNVIFPAMVKKHFDRVRRDVIPTIDYHHIFKSAHDKPYIARNPRRRNRNWRNKAVNYLPGDKLVDFTEKLLVGVSKNILTKIGHNFIPAYFQEFLDKGEKLKITHQKLTGETMNLSPGYIQDVIHEDEIPDKIVLKRFLKEGGLYDGLNTPIERGDYSISEFQEGNWYYTSNYYTRKKELKGRYFNINTPIEITREGIRYVDLEIDVVENMVGDREVIDEDLLNRALEYQIITEELHEKAKTITQKIKNREI